MKRALLVVIVVCLAAPAAADAKIRRFHTPSANIACLYSSDQPGPFLRCDVLSLNDTGFTVRRRGPARRIHITDSVVGRGRTLEYGTRAHYGPFTCRSRRVGLRCRSRVSGHGFFLNRDTQNLF